MLNLTIINYFMYSNPKLKVEYKVEELISLIENNDYDKLNAIIEAKPSLLYKTHMDENEPIYYTIRYNLPELFKLIINKSEEPYDISKIMIFIAQYGGQEILDYYLKINGIEINNVNKQLIDYFFEYKVTFTYLELELRLH